MTIVVMVMTIPTPLTRTPSSGNIFVHLADTTQRRRQQRHLQPRSCHEICQGGKHFTKSHEIWQSEELNYLGDIDKC